MSEQSKTSEPAELEIRINDLPVREPKTDESERLMGGLRAAGDTAHTTYINGQPVACDL